MFWEEKCDILHQLLATIVIVAGYLQGGENFVQEALIEVDWDQTEEMSVQERQNHIPQCLLDLCLLRMEIIETGRHIDSGCPQAEVGQARGLQLR